MSQWKRFLMVLETVLKTASRGKIGKTYQIQYNIENATRHKNNQSSVDKWVHARDANASI